MIFVTVGTDRHEFPRLVKAIDSIAKKTKEKFVVQTGRTKLKPKNCEWFDFLPEEEFQSYLKKADVIITHAGVGSIIDALKAKKPTIVIPRRKELNEHVDDHQFDIARKMEDKGKVIMCYDVNDLEEKIKEVKKLKIKDFKSSKSKISKIIKKQIEEWFPNKDLN